MRLHNMTLAISYLLFYRSYLLTYTLFSLRLNYFNFSTFNFASAPEAVESLTK